MTEREKFEAFAQKMGHTRPEAVPAASAPPDAAGAQRNGAGAAKAQRTIRKTPPNKYENGFMLDLLILRNSLKAKAPRALERLKQVNPYAARDVALALSLVDRLQLQLGETMPDSRIDYYSAMAQHGRYHLEIEGPVTPARVVLITDRQLGAVLDECIRNVCALCFKDGKEIDECPIRKAMLEVGPPETVREDGSGLGCEYRKVPGQLMKGERVQV